MEHYAGTLLKSLYGLKKSPDNGTKGFVLSWFCMV